MSGPKQKLVKQQLVALCAKEMAITKLKKRRYGRELVTRREMMGKRRGGRRKELLVWLNHQSSTSNP
jgi:hypothetical protein